MSVTSKHIIMSDEGSFLMCSRYLRDISNIWTLTKANVSRRMHPWLQHEILPVVQHFSYKDICRETNIKRRVTRSNGDAVCSLQCVVFGTVLLFSCSFPSLDFRLISDKQTTSVIVSKSRRITFEYAIEYGLSVLSWENVIFHYELILSLSILKCDV